MAWESSNNKSRKQEKKYNKQHSKSQSHRYEYVDKPSTAQSWIHCCDFKIVSCYMVCGMYKAHLIPIISDSCIIIHVYMNQHS